MPSKTQNHQPKRRSALRLPFKEREYFSENLALLLKSAVPVGEALESIKISIKSAGFKKAIEA